MFVCPLCNAGFTAELHRVQHIKDDHTPHEWLRLVEQLQRRLDQR